MVIEIEAKAYAKNLSEIEEKILGMGVKPISTRLACQF